MPLELRKMAVGDVMSLDPVVAPVDDSIEHAQQLLRDYHITGLPVVDGRGNLVGVLSQTDLVWGPGLHVTPRSSG